MSRPKISKTIQTDITDMYTQSTNYNYLITSLIVCTSSSWLLKGGASWLIFTASEIFRRTLFCCWF